MSGPTIPQLGPSTVNRKWVYQVNTGSTVAPTWATVGGVTNSAFKPDGPNWVDNTDQGGQGFKSQNKTGADWSGSLTLDRKVGQSDPTSYDPGQEYLRTHAIGKFGTSNTVEIRVFEFYPDDPTGASTPREEAYHGFCGVSWEPQGGDMLADDTVVVTLQGQGKIDLITHPYPADSLIPVIDSAAPLNVDAAGGDLVTINGHDFTGTTGVTFAGTAATSFTVVDDGLIVAVTPAHTAGSGAIVVTNASGASTTGPNVTFA